MNPKYDIAALVDDLQPVRPVSARIPLMLSAGITIMSAALIVYFQGMRPDLLSGQPDEMFLVRTGVLLLLGGATGHAVTSMASPSVGRSQNGWQIALAAATVFPLSAIIVASTTDFGPAFSAMESGIRCLMYSLLTGVATAVPMILWLRKGAPTSPTRAGWLTGVAAGGMGAFAYNIHCPFDDVVYIGLWYGLAVGICAVVGRLVVPRFIRW